MEILVTGANGFLGKAIVNELDPNHKIYSLSRTSGDFRVSLEREVPLFNHKFDLVIHAAGKAHSLPKREAERRQFHTVNVIGAENLLKGIEQVGLPEQFVFISSVSVYGQDSGINIDEDQSLGAKDPYGLSKIAAEELIIEWCKKQNVICTILRLPLLVGKNPPGNLGALLRAIDKGYYLNIGGGKARKSMVLARDVAAFITVVAPRGGIYNLTDGFHPNFNELSRAISLSMSKKTPLNLPIFLAKLMGFFGDFLGEKAPINSSKLRKITSHLTFDDSKASKLLNWNPKSVLEYLRNNTI